jgi:NSS family neurotransmitter:Na+ symporter
MLEMLEEQRENWGTRGGFVLAAVGSAVGLGNLWGFPYKLYSYGGGAFLIPYIIALLVVGIPMMVLEFSLGHYTQRAAPDAFKRGGKKFELVGWWGIILGFVIISYYPVILAYCFSFLGFSIQGIFTGGELPWAGVGIEGVTKAKEFFFTEYLGYQPGTALGAIRTNLVLPLVITWAAMYFCIFKGVKLVGKIVWLTVPLPWLMLLILAVRGLTLEGSMKGLTYYLDPVWSELAKPTTWRFAFGQVFFSLSLAFGVMITYASFLHRQSDLNNNAAIIGIADFATSFVAGLAIFATLGGMAYATQLAGNPVPVEKVVDAGPGLAFVAFPYALAQLPYSAWFSFVFFFALVTLGIDSAFSITESILASIVDKTGWRRCIVLPVMSIVGLAIGLVYITHGGLNWLGTIDGFINGTWGIAFLGLLECLVLGWLWRIERLRRHANARSDWKLGRWWSYLIRIVIPIILGGLFFWSLYDDLTQEKGFLMDPEGKWILPNCVGVAVVVIAPILSILITIARGRPDGQQVEFESHLQRVGSTSEPQRVGSRPVGIEGRKGGSVALGLAIIAAGLIGYGLGTTGATSQLEKILSWVALGAAVIALIISVVLTERFRDSEDSLSRIVGWAGLLAVVDIGAYAAMVLANITKSVQFKEAEFVKHEHLTGVSYVILTVVFLIIIGGLGWCFYRALLAASSGAAEQLPDDVGD